MMSTGEPDATEIGHVRFGKGSSEKEPNTATSPATYFTARWVRRKAARKRPGRPTGRDLAAQPILLVLAFAEHCRGVPLVDDQDTVEEFAAKGADEAFGDRVSSWCPRRCLDDAGVDGGEDGVERGGELGVAVPDEEPEPRTGVVELHEQVAGLLGQQAPVGWAVTPRMCTRRVDAR
jgi:hypothetical protein